MRAVWEVRWAVGIRGASAEILNVLVKEKENGSSDL